MFIGHIDSYIQVHLSVSKVTFLTSEQKWNIGYSVYLWYFFLFYNTGNILKET